MGARAPVEYVVVVAVDVRLDDAEGDKIEDHDDEGNNKSEGGDQGSQEGTNPAGAEGKKKSNKVETACDGVQDHGFCECLGGVFGVVGEGGAFDGAHDVGGVVADVGGGAGVTVKKG